MMARRMFSALPGPKPAKVVIAVILLAVALILLMFVYDWMGAAILDSGGVMS